MLRHGLYIVAIVIAWSLLSLLGLLKFVRLRRRHAIRERSWGRWTPGLRTEACPTWWKRRLG